LINPQASSSPAIVCIMIAHSMKVLHKLHGAVRFGGI